MRALCLLLAAFAWAPFTRSAEPTPIVFKDRDTVVRSATLAELQQSLKPQNLRVWEPHEDKTVTYRGLNLKAVLDSVYGPAWKKAELVLFTCADGYKAPVPRANIQAEKSLLAFERVGGPFSVNNRLQNQKNIPLGPLYLVWNNLKNPQIRAEEGTNWPYQVVGIELADFASKFPRMIPPQTAAASAQRGFVAFQKYCMSCHKVNGDGGDKGPELNSPQSILERRDRKWLAQWIDAPAKLNPATTMPALNLNLKNRKRVIDDILAYLAEMAKQGRLNTNTSRKSTHPAPAGHK